MPPSGPQPALRLVGTGVAGTPRAMPRGNTVVRLADGPVPSKRKVAAAAREVASENHSAALSALDPRWALAVRTSSMLQGGRAAILPPESRRFLVTLAKDINLRPFDANLVIAIVQDAARAGHDPIGAEARTRLAMVAKPAIVDDRPVLRWLIAAILLGSMGAWFMIRAFGS